MNSKERRFERFSFYTLLYTLLVVVWGAYVRASGSGAGCGSHWPLCNGEVIPQSVRVQTWIEFAHRASSGVNLVLIAFLLGLSFFWSESKSPVRRAAMVTMAAMLTEAALGAMLVLLAWVGVNKSIGRTVSMALHLANTLFLLASLATLWWCARSAENFKPVNRPILCREKDFMYSAVLFVVVGVMGAMTALGDTLFPAANWTQGLEQHLDPARHFLVSLRIFHPVVAVMWVVLTFQWAIVVKSKLPRHGMFLMGMFVVQLAIGVANLALLAPVALQLLHLFGADLLWLVFWTSGLAVNQISSSVMDSRFAVQNG